MVVVKRLDPNYPRMGYEVQKGLMIDMPGGDGKADVIKGEDGSLTLSERDGKYQVTLKDVHLSDVVDHDVQIKLKRSPNVNQLTLEDVIINAPTSTLIYWLDWFGLCGLLGVVGLCIHLILPQKNSASVS